MGSAKNNALSRRYNFYGGFRRVEQNYSANSDDNFTSGVMVNGQEMFSPNQFDGAHPSSGSLERDESKFRVRPNSILAQLGLPCQTEEEHDYEQCYSYYANGCYNVCQFVDVGDIEDFM